MLSACNKLAQTVASLVVGDRTTDGASDAPTPLNGELIHQQTRQEVRAALETVAVYIIPIPTKCANEVINALRPIVPRMELQHLRRLARMPYMPAPLLAKLPKHPFPPEVPVLYLLMCPANRAPINEVEDLVRPTTPFRPRTPGQPSPEPQISIVDVPLNMPTTLSQADEWSQNFWPTVYKRGNPFGPHPALVEAAAEKLFRVSEYMAVAREAGRQAAEAKVGHPFGAVIVDPTTGDIVAVAGDGRFALTGREWANPLDHTVLRLVSMAAQKRLQEGVQVSPDNQIQPLTEIERKFFPSSTIDEAPQQAPQVAPDVENGNENGNEKSGAYLCHNMQVYLTHEPCVMCSMALLHSRVGTVVFERRMPGAGALTSEGAGEGEGLGHGLFWRPDLNWKYLCWQWKENGIKTPKDKFSYRVSA